MKKTLLGLIILVVTIAVFTNPKDYEYKAEVKKVYENNMGVQVDTFSNDFEKSGYDLGKSLGLMVVDNQINSKINRDNYLFFSIAKWEDNYIGYGVFGNINLSDDFKSSLENIESNN